MKIYNYVAIALSIVAHPVLAYEYVYPVALCSELSTPLLLVHQNALGRLKLLGWNPVTGSIEYLLAAPYSPAALCVLPDHSGVSFIENDRLRIKSFIKRSPCTYDFSYPVHHINTVVWDCNGNGYFSALYRGHYAIFKIDNQDNCTCIMSSTTADCMYPNCVEETLYFLERRVSDKNIQQNYTVKSMVLKNIHAQSLSHAFEPLDKQLALLIDNDDTETILADSDMASSIADFGQLPIMHLTMITASFGWVLELPKDFNLKLIEFTCYTLHFIEGRWQTIRAFSFTVPRDLIFGANFNQGRLYESLLPLLPRFIHHALYFTCTDRTEFLGIYKYTLATHTIDRLTPIGACAHFFAPLESGLGIVCGGSLSDKQSVFSCSLSSFVSGEKLTLPIIS